MFVGPLNFLTFTAGSFDYFHLPSYLFGPESVENGSVLLGRLLDAEYPILGLVCYDSDFVGNFLQLRSFLSLHPETVICMPSSFSCIFVMSLPQFTVRQPPMAASRYSVGFGPVVAIGIRVYPEGELPDLASLPTLSSHSSSARYSRCSIPDPPIELTPFKLDIGALIPLMDCLTGKTIVEVVRS